MNTKLVYIKKTVAILFIFSLSIFLTGCLGGDDSDNVTPNGNTSVVPQDQPITLIWWNLFESEENVQPLIDAYQALHPNVTIEYSERDPAEYKQDLERVLTDGLPESTPDIFTVQSNTLGRYQNYTISAPPEVIDTATFQSNFYPVVYDDLTMNETPRAIPLGIDSIAIIYNKDLLSAKGYSVPSSTWDQLYDQAEALTVTSDNKLETIGLSLGADDNSEFGFDVFNLLLLQSEVDMVNITRDEAVFAEDDAVQEAINYVNSYEEGGLWGEGQKQDIALFLEGKLAMYAAPSWRLLDIIAYNETYNLGLDVGIAPVPQLSTLEDASVGWSTYWAQTVSLDSKNYKVAWDFLNYASQPDQLRLLFAQASETRAFGQIYPRPDMKAELENDEYLSTYVNEVDRSKTWYMFDKAEVEVIFQRMLKGETSLDSAAQDITRILNSEGLLDEVQ